jgi:hypothetical protein
LKLTTEDGLLYQSVELELKKTKSVFLNLCLRLKFFVSGTAETLEETTPCEEIGFW